MGTLKTEPARTRLDLLAAPVAAAIERWPDEAPVDVYEVLVAPIDAELADTAAFCAAYEVGLDESANCVVVAGKRGGETRYAACIVLATTRADVNGVVRWGAALNFGGGDPCEVRILVQNVVFKTLAAHQGLPNNSLDGGVRSCDENGDGLVAIQDLSIFQQEFVNTGTRQDFRGDLAQPFDGLTAIQDLSQFQQHFTAP